MVRQRTGIVCAAIGLAAATAAIGQDLPELPAELGATLALANRAHVRYDVESEYRLLQHAATLPGDATSSALVQRRLAVLEWRYFGDVEAGRSRLRALDPGSEAAEAWLALARLEHAAHRFPAAQMAADRALAAANDGALRDRAQRAFLRAVIGGATAHRLAGEPIAAAATAFARDELDVAVSAVPGELEGSRLLLKAALLTDDGDAARTAWRSYHHVFPGAPMPGLLAAAGSGLDRLLAELHPDNLDVDYRVELVRALVGLRFIEEAALVARDPRLDADVRRRPEVAVLLVYADAIHRLRAEVEEYYRRQILGDYDPDYLTGVVRRAGLEVWEAAHGGTAPPADADLWGFLERRFGAIVELARVNRRHDLRMGHLVADEMRQVEQGERGATLRFVALDNMVSYGFRDWAWEHRRGARGFASSSVITQIRPLYVPEALRAWELVSDTETRGRYERVLRAQTARDDARALADPHAYLPGLAMRLQHQGRLQLLADLEAQGLNGDRLRTAYLLDYQAALRDSSIIAHEGRHALDLSRPAEYHREFAAKLAEIALAPRPRLAFAGIIDPTIGDGSFHGTGNQLVMQAMVRWIDAHRNSIVGLEPGRPLLPQLDLLTDEQLRQAGRDSDPRAIANGAARPDRVRSDR
jgi:hypothetical protein